MASVFSLIKELGMESPGVVNVEQFERAHPDLVQLLLAHQDAYQGHDYWKTYLRQLSKMWLAPLHYTDEDLKKIGEPTLILAGDRDDVFVSVEQAVDMYRMIPKAELAIAPGADHFVAWSKFELFTQLIMDFLLRQSLGSE
jgi:pimeloyl-ACP methyl ester carboxylesterase